MLVLLLLLEFCLGFIWSAWFDSCSLQTNVGCLAAANSHQTGGFVFTLVWFGQCGSIGWLVVWLVGWWFGWLVSVVQLVGWLVVCKQERLRDGFSGLPDSCS